MNRNDVGPLEWGHLDAKNLWFNQDAASQKSFDLGQRSFDKSGMQVYSINL